MPIHERTEGDVTILELEGKFLGGPETMEIHFMVKELIDNGRNQIVFDMSRTRLLNSSALGVIVSCVVSLRDANGNLKLCCLKDRMKGLFKVTDIISIFEVYDSLGAALASYL